MTSTIRCIVLVSACSLWSACQDTQAASDTPAVARRSPEASSKHAVPALGAAAQSPTHALTAAAPEPVRSIADRAPTQERAVPEPVTQQDEAEQSFDRALSASEVKVERFVLARDVKGREPVNVSDTFDTDTGKIFAFVQLANNQTPFAFRVHWEPVAGPRSPYGVTLSVPTAERFRTWSWTAIERKPGRYKAVLRTLEGEEIASRELTIMASDGE